MSLLPIRFEYISQGDNFLWNDKTYMKIESIKNEEGKLITAVQIGTGNLMFFEDDLKCWII